MEVNNAEMRKKEKMPQLHVHMAGICDCPQVTLPFSLEDGQIITQPTRPPPQTTTFDRLPSIFNVLCSYSSCGLILHLILRCNIVHRFIKQRKSCNVMRLDNTNLYFLDRMSYRDVLIAVWCLKCLISLIYVNLIDCSQQLLRV